MRSSGPPDEKERRPDVFVRSAQSIEKKRDELSGMAKERGEEQENGVKSEGGIPRSEHPECWH